MSPMTLPRWSRALFPAVLLAPLALTACPATEEAPSEAPPAQQPSDPPASQPTSQPSSQPGSQPGSRPAEHPNTSTVPPGLGELFRVKEGTPAVVGKVGSVDIRRDQLERHLRLMQIQYESGGLPPSVGRREILAAARDELVDRALHRALADQVGANADPKAVEEYVADVEARMASQPAFRNFLARAGNTREHRLEDATMTLRIQAIIDGLKSELKTRTATESEAYFRMHQRDFLEPEGLELWRIHVKAPAGMNERDAAANKARAEGLHKQLVKKPQDFENVARAYSEGGKASEGGYLGFRPRGTFPAELEALLWKAKAGSIAPLQQDASGYYIFKVGRVQKEKQRTYAEVKDQIAELTIRPLIEKELKRRIEHLRATLPISFDLDALE